MPVYYLFMVSTYTDVYSSQNVLQLFYAWSVNVPHTHTHTRTHTVSILSCPRALKLSLDISVNAGFLLYERAVIRDKIKGTFYKMTFSEYARVSVYMVEHEIT